MKFRDDNHFRHFKHGVYPANVSHHFAVNLEAH